MGLSSDTTSSGHSTSDGASPRSWAAISAVAANWAAVTVAGSTSDLRRPRTPPPWTDAAPRVRTAGPPSGATAPQVAMPTTTASTPTPNVATGTARAGRLRRRSRRAARARGRPPSWSTIASPLPPSQTSPTSSSGPPSRAAPAMRARRLAQRDATHGKAPERPRRSERLGEHHGAGQRGGAPPGPARDRRTRQCRCQRTRGP